MQLLRTSGFIKNDCFHSLHEPSFWVKKSCRSGSGRHNTLALLAIYNRPPTKENYFGSTPIQNHFLLPINSVFFLQLATLFGDINDLYCPGQLL
jgi:hypothetical protein